MLQIYNSLTRRKEEFKPLVPGKISIYVCGNTVYDYCHLGHARTMVSFDVITRYLRSCGYDVNYVRNITDIDDKIICRANELGIDYQQLTKRFIDAQNEDATALNMTPPNAEPRATDHIEHIIAMITRLLDNDTAYIADNGDVYYRVESFANYGQLAHKDIAGQQAGARVDVEEVKCNPLDFVLWKQAKPDEPIWPSPWGLGRPGWHIECSAMSTHCLGDQFDIHGGGADLKFPHHENEIAQTEAATGKPFVNTWMHVGFLQINEEKMSKSLGNFFTIRNVLEKYSAEVVRYFLLSSHYRSQLNYSTINLDNAHAALERLYLSLRDLPHAKLPLDSEFEQQFQQAMDDDFNTPQALAVLFAINHKINQSRDNDPELAAQLGQLLKHLGGIMGILQHSSHEFLQGDVNAEQTAQIEQLIRARENARQQKNWAQADTFRQQLHEMGVEIEDTAQGTKWRMQE